MRGPTGHARRDGPPGVVRRTGALLTTPTRPATGRQARAEATRSRILDETVACILEEGFAAASAKHIAERAGVTWGVVQYHFGDRSGILAAVTQLGLDELVTRLHDVRVPDGTHREQLSAVVDAGCRAFTTPLARAGFEILVATRATPIPELEAQQAPFAREVGRLARRLSSDRRFGRVLLSSLRGLALVQLTQRAEVDFAADRAALVDVLLAYLD